MFAKGETRFEVKWKERYPCLNDNTGNTGFDRHYIYHTAWAARLLKELKPVKHVDISSDLYFSSLVSAFIPIDFYDYRPAELILPNLACKQADLVNLPFESDSLESLSCMHVVEHIGLGRYGDSLDNFGDLTATKELSRVLASNGYLFFVVPVGKPSIYFNAHRVYSYEQVVEMFSTLNLVEFSLIPDDVDQPITYHANPKLVAEQKYACGCFLFKKE
jgi:SAM-dependent methyltransferase